jgi:hypothetical protein
MAETMVGAATPSISTTQQPASATVGSSIADQATVSGGAGPTGTVTFNLYNNANATGTPLFTDTESLSGGSATSAGYTTTAAGTDYWVATYNGDADNNSVLSGTAAEPVTVSAASPSLSVSAPSGGTAGSNISASSISASLSGGYSPTGSITFTVIGPQSSEPTLCTGGTTVGTAVSVSGNGTYNPSSGFTPTRAGDYWWYASYGGDSNTTPAVSACGSSMAGTVVTPPAPSNVSAPTLSGTVQQGQTLSGSHGSWTNTPTSFAYQWQDCDSSGNSCAAITGATGQTYTLTAGDLGHTLRVTESATNAGGTGGPVSSAQSGVVAAPPVTATAPSDQTLPQVIGVGTVGEVLSSSPGTWSGTAPIVFTAQWQRCAPGCSNIAGATASTYTLAPADAGAVVRVVATATNNVGSAQASSTQLGPIATIAPSAAQIKASLLRQLAPQGKAAKIAALLKRNGYGLSLTAMSAGKLVIDWYYLPAGAHLARAKPKPVLLAAGKATFSQAGTQTLTITLTANGKQLLKHAKRLKLTATGTFTPAGKSAIVATTNFTLTR